MIRHNDQRNILGNFVLVDKLDPGEQKVEAVGQAHVEPDHRFSMRFLSKDVVGNYLDGMKEQQNKSKDDIVKHRQWVGQDVPNCIHSDYKKENHWFHGMRLNTNSSAIP